MRWIKFGILSILRLIVLATAALAIAGSGPDANRLQCSLVIRQKPAATWPWLYEPDKAKQWVTWLVEVREEGKGEPAAGDKAVWVMEDRNNGNTLSAAEAFHGTSTYTLAGPPDGSTVLGSDSRYTFENGFARFMTPLVVWQAKKKMLSDMGHLRTLAEAKP